jgi:hypothetical protein
MKTCVHISLCIHLRILMSLIPKNDQKMKKFKICGKTLQMSEPMLMSSQLCAHWMLYAFSIFTSPAGRKIAWWKAQTLEST